MKYLSLIFATIIICYITITANATDNLNTTSWQSYKNSQFDFALKYPSRLATSKQFNRAYFLRNTWSMHDYTNSANSDKQHPVIQIQLQNTSGKGSNGEPYYYQSYVRVGVSSEPADVADCDNSKSTTPPDQTQFTTVINNVVFDIAEFSDAGMMQYNSGTSYSHLYKGQCYRIEYVETGSNPSVIPDYANVTDHNQMIAKAIIQSFRFMNNDKSSSLKLMGGNFGNITSATPYDLMAVKAALPDYQVDEKSFETEGMQSSILTISKGKQVLVKLFPSPLAKGKILCGATKQNIANNPLNIKMGAAFSSIYSGNQAPHCMAGLEEMSGNVICAAPNATSIYYVFTGKSHAVDGKIPSKQHLASWALTQIDWLADPTQAKYLAQYCRVD